MLKSLTIFTKSLRWPENQITNEFNNHLHFKIHKKISIQSKEMKILQCFLKNALVDIRRPDSGDAEGEDKDAAETSAVSFH